MLDVSQFTAMMDRICRIANAVGARM